MFPFRCQFIPFLLDQTHQVLEVGDAEHGSGAVFVCGGDRGGGREGGRVKTAGVVLRMGNCVWANDDDDDDKAGTTTLREGRKWRCDRKVARVVVVVVALCVFVGGCCLLRKMAHEEEDVAAQ